MHALGKRDEVALEVGRSPGGNAIQQRPERVDVRARRCGVNAVFANKIAAIDDETERAAFVDEQRRLYEADVDLLRLASELVIDAVVDFPELRGEVARRLHYAEGKRRQFSERRHGVPPV